MSFRVRLTALAAVDFEKRLTDLAERSPGLATRLNDRFEKACGFAIFRSPVGGPTRIRHSRRS